METTRLGASDLDVSRVGLGCNNFGSRLDRAATRAVIDAALDEGITFLDTADIYGANDSERFIGAALEGRRDRVVLATKFGSDSGLDVPYFPLESGLLTGKYRRGEPHPEGARLSGRDDRLTDETLGRVEAFEAFASERGLTPLEVAIGGLASIPGIASVIAGATSPEQVRANAQAGAWRATPEELEEISRALR